MRLRTLLLIAGAFAVMSGCPRPKPAAHSTTPRPLRHFAILGDVRPPHAVELWAKPSHRERAVLIRSVVAEEPAFVAIHGDFVFNGSSKSNWLGFDQELVAVKRDVVPLVVGSRKTLAYVAGHVHSYERFQRQGKTFLVTGGGGAPIRALRSGKALRHRDDLYRAGPWRPHHYVSVRIAPAGLELTTRGLHRGARQLHVMERFSLPWAAAAAPSPTPSSNPIERPCPALESARPRASPRPSASSGNRPR